MEWVGRDTVWEDARKFDRRAYLAPNIPIFGAKNCSSRSYAARGGPPATIRALFNLVPSLWDVFNFTAIEAMASGRPTIVSDGAGASELIEDGANGFVFRSGDANALATAIERLIT